MRTVDTNVVVRLLTADEPKQTAAARKLFEEEEVFLSRTVLLETYWVLHATYELPTNTIVEAMAGLLGLDGVQVEDQDKVAAALDLTRAGMDFADALHVMASPPGTSFATFNHALRKTARRAGCPISITVP